MTVDTHVHTPDCVGGNELGELCCLDLSGERLMDAVTWHVPVAKTYTAAGRSTPGVVAVFTYDADDAIALAVAAGYPVARGIRPVHVPTADPYTGEVR